MKPTTIPASTPVIVGVGQFVERLSAPNYQAMSAVDIAAAAAEAALQDTNKAQSLAGHIDLVATTRTFNDSARHLRTPFGASNNFPRSIAARLGVNPTEAIWEDSGGNTPQQLVSEACERIANGEFRAALIAGAENISTARKLLKEEKQVDWSETVEGSVENRHGQQTSKILSRHSFEHGLLAAPPLYGMCENAKRFRMGASREAWRREMADWFAPFTAVAAANVYASADNRAYTAEELATIGDSNRLIADPYPRLMVAKDQVNQGASIVVTSLAVARELGIDPERCVYLHGYAAAREKILEHRPDLGVYPAAVSAAQAALSRAHVTTTDLQHMDFYSCFPIAVTSVAEPIGLTSNDPRGLTVTGGLPYFGGPGNNYSMHAIASMVERLRLDPGAPGFIGANGGFLSKYAVGIYSTTPRAFVASDDQALQQALDAEVSPPFTESPSGQGEIESFAIEYARDGSPGRAIVIGRLTDNAVRFIARTADDDTTTSLSMAREEPIGATIQVQRTADGNRFTMG